MSEALQSELARIDTLIERRFKLSSGTMPALGRVRRHLPYRHKKAVDALVRARDSFEHPRLALTLDEARLLRQARHLHAYLSELDLVDRRKGRALDIATTVFFALLVVVGLAVAVLRWRGFV